ncbi:MAG: GIY-YIG nuclease family protein [Clostridiales bacterium]|nr:GIY-YIG nuclease family protein [Clostridiales bacterium]
MDKEKLKNLPEKPGIYRMLDKEGNIIYIGKSKCLKQRVSTYFSTNPKWEKARKMAPFIDDVVWTVTDTHLEAMLLECESIKKIKPFFNAMMKNDSRYVYLKVSEKRAGKILKIVWEREADTFGPFRSRGRVEELAAFFPHLFPVTEKEDGSCGFSFHIFPKELKGKEREENREKLIKIFTESGEMEAFRRELENRMVLEAGNQRFELAGKYRDFLENVNYVNRELHLYENLSSQYILYVVPKEKRYKIFLIFDGRILHRAWVDELTEEVKSNFVKEALALPEEKRSVYESEKAGRDFQDILYGELSRKLEHEKEKVEAAEQILPGIRVRTLIE